MKHTQVAIIGAGPVGLFTAFYARLRGLDVTLIDSLENVGGK
ncbi:Ferredoxin--NADP reductase 2 [Weissella viridescens]|uniref:Ferredoxin--NADP reductase 2 n=1 Tax=Weissella viridescens TaxID=1629 RepID=A0A380P835_WEIVI|nr:Ferredoxin--NADP reductase 2 [Weissella viridescens]